MEDGNRKERGEIFNGGGSGGQGRAAAVHGGVQAEGFAGSGGLSAARRDRGAIAARGFVLVESDPLAQAARERRTGGVNGEEKRPQAPELIASRPNEVWSWDITKL